MNKINKKLYLYSGKLKAKTCVKTSREYIHTHILHSYIQITEQNKMYECC